MHKAKSSVPDMLMVIAPNRGNLFYIIILSYVLLSLMAAFHLDNCRHKVVHIRSKRGTNPIPFSCGAKCTECPQSPNGCSSCQRGWFIYLHQQVSYCVAECPVNYGTHSSGREGNVCERCNDPNCSKCNSHTSYCSKCKSKFYLYLGKCYSVCPDSMSRNKHLGICEECNDRKCAKCLSQGRVCTKCKPEFYLHAGKCYAKCPKPLVKNHHRGTCENIQCKLTPWSAFKPCRTRNRKTCCFVRRRKLKIKGRRRARRHCHKKCRNVCPATMKQTTCRKNNQRGKSLRTGGRRRGPPGNNRM